MTEQDEDAVIERFPATSGRLSGVLGLVLLSVFLVLSLLAWSPETPLGVAILSVLGAVLIWAVLLRPSLWVTRRDLVMRNVFHTDRIPLAAIESVVVTQVLTVRTARRRYVSPAVGYTVRQNVKVRFRSKSSPPPSETKVAQAFVESRLAHLAEEGRNGLGVRRGSPEQAALAAGVRREWAWPELGAVVLLAAGFVVWLLN